MVKRKTGVDMDYSHRYYKTVSMSRKRQIINHIVDDLHTMQLDMIDQAVDYSDLQEAKQVIQSIMDRS
jgi:hypothetical protein